jgi:hypothetical protein
MDRRRPRGCPAHLPCRHRLPGIGQSVRGRCGRSRGIADTLYFENRPRLAYHLYDGTVYHIYPGDPLPDADDRFYFRLQVVTQPAPDTTRLDSVDASRPDETAVSEEPAPGLNKMMASWVYVIPAWKHGSFVLDPELFMEASQ